MTEVSVNNYIFLVYLGLFGAPFFALYDTHNPSPRLCRNYNPLSQQLRQESGSFLGFCYFMPFLLLLENNLHFLLQVW